MTHQAHGNERDTELSDVSTAGPSSAAGGATVSVGDASLNPGTALGSNPYNASSALESARSGQFSAAELAPQQPTQGPAESDEAYQGRWKRWWSGLTEGQRTACNLGSIAAGTVVTVGTLGGVLGVYGPKGPN